MWHYNIYLVSLAQSSYSYILKDTWKPNLSQQVLFITDFAKSSYMTACQFACWDTSSFWLIKMPFDHAESSGLKRV